MKETSTTSAVDSDIVFIQKTLADMKFREFVHLPISRIIRLTNLFRAVESDERFAEVFPKDAVVKSRKYVFSPKRCEVMKSFMQNHEAYANWCCAKLHLRIENCMFKVRQMLEGVAFDNTEISTERMQVYQSLYNVVSDSGESLEDRRIARAEAQARKK